MPTMPAVDKTKYREVEFIGGRILQDRELQLFEDLERDVPTKGKYELGALFDPGAPLNVKPQIVGGAVTLLPVDSSKPMMVFVRGAFEAFTATDAPAIVFTPQTAGVVNRIFLNYVVWRVTQDGAGGTTMTDPSLIDSGTGEATAEMGQLQVVIGADAHTSLDTGVMFDCNSVPVPMFAFTWQTDGSLKLTAIAGFGDQAQASPIAPGVVKLSTATSETAVSLDDPSVTNTRTPSVASVTTASVKPVTAASPNTVTVSFLDQNGAANVTTLAAVQTAATSGGIGTQASFYETWTCTVHDALGFIWSKVVAAYAVLKSLGDRITALENAPSVNLAGHVNQPLGPGVHPAVSTTDFTANNCAFKVVDAAGVGAITGAIDNQGNYQFLRTDAQAEMTSAAGVCLKDYRTLAGAVKTMLDIPAPAPGSLVITLGGDLSGESTDATVIQLQGRRVANTAPAEGQGLVFTGGAWTPETLQGVAVSKVDIPVAAPSNGVGAATMTYFIFTIGKTRIAFGNSQLRGGHVIPVPTSDWNSATLAGSWGIVQATVSIGVLQSGGYGVQTYIDGSMTIVVNVWNAGSVFSVLNAQALGTYVNVNVIAISQDA